MATPTKHLLLNSKLNNLHRSHSSLNSHSNLERLRPALLTPLPLMLLPLPLLRLSSIHTLPLLLMLRSCVISATPTWHMPCLLLPPLLALL